MLISRPLYQLWFVYCCLCFASLTHAQGPENTLVVVNADSQDSMAVANRYIDLRNIPAANVVYLSGITHEETPKEETGQSENFLKQIGRPVMAAIKERQLSNQISCITYSAGFPTRFNAKAQAAKLLENRAPNKVWNGSVASITSLTYFYNDIFSPQPRYYLNPNANRFANLPSESWLKNPFVGETARRFDHAQTLIKNKDFIGASEILAELYRAHPRQMSVVISIARTAAMHGDRKKAINALTYAASQGFDWGPALLQDKAFDSIRKNRDFKSVIASMTNSSDRLTPTRNFSPRDYWATNGWPNGTADQGQRYYLSTVLAVVGDNGRSTLESALQQMDRSCGADDTHPKADVYFCKNKGVRSRTRTPLFETAASELNALGHNAIIGAWAIVPKKTLVGATLGSSAIDVEKSGSKFCKGALCDNLTSYGGSWQVEPQTKLNAYLDFGAAGASGTVREPSAIANKFPTARLHVHYARGCTLAESFYLSVKWPFQLLIAGDPLCSPYGNFPQFSIVDFQGGSTVAKNFVLKLERQANTPKIKHFEVFYDDVFREISKTDEIPISTDSMPDGYHEVRIVGVSDSPVAKRTTRKIDFIFGKKGHSVTIDVENPRCSVSGMLQVKAVSSEGQKIQIMQNSRTIMTVTSDKSFSIPASRLGLGSTKLQAVATLPDGQMIKSSPVSVVLEPSSKGRTGEPLKAPSDQDLNRAVGSVRELLQDQYADRSLAGRKNLLSSLQQITDESIDAPVFRFALLTEFVATATDLAAIDQGWTACDQLQTAYDVKPIPHIKFTKKIKSNLKQQSASSLYERGTEKIYQLIAQDRFDDAEDLTKALESSVRKWLPATIEELEQLTKKAKSLKRAFKKIQDDLETLEVDPLNAVANAEVGMFYCEEKLDFERGLPYLAKSSSRKIRELAKLEMKLGKPSAEQRLAVADRWWNLGSDKKLDSFKSMAAYHYQQIVDELEGQPKTTAQNRINEVLPPADLTIAQLLSDDAWQVKWSKGDQWNKMQLENGRVRVSLPSGNVFFLEFLETDGVARLRSKSRNLDLRATQRNGTGLQLIQVDRQGQPMNVTAIVSKYSK